MLHCEESVDYIHHLEQLPHYTSSFCHGSFVLHSGWRIWGHTLTDTSVNGKFSPLNFPCYRLTSHATVKNQKPLCKGHVGRCVSAYDNGKVWDEVVFMQHVWRSLCVYVCVTGLGALIRGGGCSGISGWLFVTRSWREKTEASLCFQWSFWKSVLFLQAVADYSCISTQAIFKGSRTQRESEREKMPCVLVL